MHARIGWVAERLKAPVLKTGKPERVSWVRIPPHPPHGSNATRTCLKTTAGLTLSAGHRRVSFMKKAIRIFIVAATALVAPLLATASPYYHANAYERIATSCCPCPPGASDQQCFLQCNALLPRCQAPTARYVVPPSLAPRTTTVQACTTALTGFCCAQGWRYYSGPTQGLKCPGAACYVYTRTWPTSHKYLGNACW